MKTSDFYFDLPKELIAQDPLEDRASSRLLMVDKNTGETKHEIFRNIVDYLYPGDCLVLNNTKVLPARLLGQKEDTGAAVEILLLKRRDKDVWETLVKPGKKMRPGAKVVFGDGRLRAEVIDVMEEGNRLVRLLTRGFSKRFWTALEKCRSLHTLRISCRIRTAIRLSMPNMTARRRHLRQVCTLQQNSLIKSRKRA